MHDDVHSAEFVADCISNDVAPILSHKVCGNKLGASGRCRDVASRCQDLSAKLLKQAHSCKPGATCAGCDQGALSFEREKCSHGAVSNRAGSPPQML